MKHPKLLIVGFGVAALGAIGTYNAYHDIGVPPVEKVDVTTVGKVTDLTVTELNHALGVTLDRTYSMDYVFQAEDGKMYAGEHNNIDEAKFNSLSYGEEIKVKYHSNQPSINGAPYYGHYTSVNDLPDATPESRLYFCLGTLALGALVMTYALLSSDNDVSRPLPT